MATKELRYINGNGVYSVEDGGSADVQSLMIDDTVDEAIISHRVAVAENRQNVVYRKFQAINHSYYTIEDATYIIEKVSNSEQTTAALNLPQYLTGWQLSDETAFSGVGSTVDATFISTYFSNDTNLDLYGVWGDTKFLRVIVSTFDSSDVPSGQYRVAITNSMSYDSTNVFTLSPEFAMTVDYSNRQRHLSLRSNGVDGGYLEIATGNGCPLAIDGVTYPSYFAFKSGTNSTIGLTISNSVYIPFYNVYLGSVTYSCWLCDEGLSRDFYDKGTALYLTTSNNALWTGSLNGATSDKTVFIRLVHKPVVTATVHVKGTGKINITDTTTIPSTINEDAKSVIKMPAEHCTLWAQAATGYVFNGWYYDENCTLQLPTDGNGHPYTSTQYDITSIEGDFTAYADFVADGYTITYYKE